MPTICQDPPKFVTDNHISLFSLNGHDYFWTFLLFFHECIHKNVPIIILAVDFNCWFIYCFDNLVKILENRHQPIFISCSR